MVWRNRSRSPLRCRVELGLAFEHGVEALNGRDDDLGGGIDGVAFEPLNGVKRRELPRVVGRREIGELVLGLLAEIAAVHQEEDALCIGELEQAIGDVDGRKGFAGAGGHLDQGARGGIGKGILEIVDGSRLDFPEPRFIEGW